MFVEIWEMMMILCSKSDKIETILEEEYVRGYTFIL